MAAREQLIATLANSITAEEHFLVPIKEGKPNWQTARFRRRRSNAGVRWKLLNIGRMKSAAHADALAKLKAKPGVE